MALTDENGGASIPATMLVGPTGYGGYPMYQGGNGGNGGFGDGNGWWVILLFLLLLGNNGWGNNGWGNNGGGNGGAGGLYPWMNQSNQINDGFRDQMLNNNVTEIRTGVTGLANQLCNCCSDVQMALANGFAGVEQGANARQMANMNQQFAAQTAQAQGFNAVQAQLAQCCCDNRLASADLKYTIATENCADRAAVNDGIRDVVTAGTANTQAVLNAIKGISDQLCQDKIDAKNDTIAQLRQELLYARGQASQDVQTAAIRAGQATTANQLIQEMRSCPVPSMPVYGMTPIFTCPQNNGCGCGCNA